MFVSVIIRACSHVDGVFKFNFSFTCVVAVIIVALYVLLEI